MKIFMRVYDKKFMKENDTYTLKELASRIEFDEEDYKPLMKAFIEETESDLRVINEKIGLKGERIISERIHNIKGASLNLGLYEISQILEQLSTMNHAGEYEAMEDMLNSCYLEVDNLRRLI